MKFFSQIALVAMLFIVSGVQAQQNATSAICISETGNYTVVLDLYAGELGYYTFVECPDMVNPTIGMEYGVTYNFIQAHRSNWYHPMGFAYFPDGAHDNVDELEPTISHSANSSCVNASSCPAPRYFRDGLYLGDPLNPADFGLDVYEPEFFRGITEWAGAGTYSIQLTFDDETYTKDIFYFCHIHQYMSGRIKLLKDGVAVSDAFEPELGYSYNEPGDFDKQCGTYDLDEYQLPNIECPETFVCLDDAIVDEKLITYAHCIDAMNCHMVSGMTTQYSANSPVALFIHQMIPHHQNAVNMAKVLLFQNILKCDDLTQQDDPDCHMEAILRDIIVTQNFQIQGMRAVLEQNNFAPSADCMVPIALSDSDMDNTNNTLDGNRNENNNSNDTTSGTSQPTSMFLNLSWVGLMVLLSSLDF